MSKKENYSSQPAVEKLLADGSLTLTAESRADIYVQGEALIAALPDGTKWTRSFVEFCEDKFTQTYLLIKDK